MHVNNQNPPLEKLLVIINLGTARKRLRYIYINIVFTVIIIISMTLRQIIKKISADLENEGDGAVVRKSITK